MRFPKGLGFDMACGLVVTVVLDDFVRLTGTFLGEIQEKHHHRKSDDRHEFILIQLTQPVCGKKEEIIPEGTFCAINIDKIQIIFPGVKCPDKKHDKWDDQEEKYDCDHCDEKYDNKCDEDKEHDKCDKDKEHDKCDKDKKHDKCDKDKEHDKCDKDKEYDKCDKDKEYDKCEKGKCHDKWDDNKW